MKADLAKRVDELVAMGWEPTTTTETTVSLVGRRPFSWWLFLFVIVFFPVVFLTGIPRFLFQPLAVTVTFAVVASYLIAMLVIPANL